MKVSIIIPYKEDRGWLKHAITSVHNQTYKGEIELILSKSQHRVGYNLNRGIEKATGEYIKYLCDDDWLTPESIQRSVECMEGHDFIHGCAYNVFKGISALHKPRMRQPTLSDMLRGNVIHGGTLMYRRDLFDRIGLFDEELECGEEYELNMRALKLGMKLGYCPYILYNYRRHEQQKSLGKNVNQYLRMQKMDEIKRRFI